MEQSRIKLEELTASMNGTHAAYQEMLEFYGETEAAQNGGKLFNTIHTFCLQFEAEQTKQAQQAKLEAKRSTKAAADGSVMVVV